MARLIDADALKEELAPQDDWSWKNGAYVRDMIDSAPTGIEWFVNSGFNCFTALDKDNGDVLPTFWMTLPEPPKEDDDAE